MIPVFAPTLFMPKAVAGYPGPIDLIANPTYWGGMRAGSNAKLGTKCCQITRGNLATSDFNSLTTGSIGHFDVSGATTFIQGSTSGNRFGRVTKLYDQSANLTDAVQSTFANAPGLAWGNDSGVTLPSPIDAAFSGNNSINQFLSMAMSGTLAQPFTVVFVAYYNGLVSVANNIMGDAGNFLAQFRKSATDDVGISAAGTGSVTTGVSEAHQVWHTFQFVFNGTSSVIAVDTTQTTVNDGSATNAMAATMYLVNSQSASGTSFDGWIAEMGIWPIAFSGTQMTNMSSNCRTFWGF